MKIIKGTIKPTTIGLDRRCRDWVEEQWKKDANFSFSKWVRDKVLKEIKKEENQRIKDEQDKRLCWWYKSDE